MYYRDPVFRPPSEAHSLLIQATEGCTYRCSFCVSNLGKTFKIRKTEDIKQDLDTAKEIYGPNVRRVFFLDGNAMVMPFDPLKEITKYAHNIFPHLERVAVYAHGKDILGKTQEQLNELSEAGLKMAYIGIETGNNDLLKKIGKRETAEDIVKAFHKCYKAGITPSGTVILGLAGKNEEKSRKHAIDTAKLINRASPTQIINEGQDVPIWYISALTLMIPRGTPLYKEKVEGEFKPMNADEILREMRIIIANITEDVNHCVFRSNHASNYLAIKGTLSKDKDKILKIIDSNLKDHRNIRPEFYRAL
ncbi:MAG: radical SAM protein [Candidatus Lokiarchaeota archaeon]|nr:radical SAM protein [Candidatus Lokiarchaeota archaeon]